MCLAFMSRQRSDDQREEDAHDDALLTIRENENAEQAFHFWA